MFVVTLQPKACEIVFSTNLIEISFLKKKIVKHLISVIC